MWPILMSYMLQLCSLNPGFTQNGVDSLFSKTRLKLNYYNKKGQILKLCGFPNSKTTFFSREKGTRTIHTTE